MLTTAFATVTLRPMDGGNRSPRPGSMSNDESSLGGGSQISLDPYRRRDVDSQRLAAAPRRSDTRMFDVEMDQVKLWIKRDSPFEYVVNDNCW
jgi:hypothetical protein